MAGEVQLGEVAEIIMGQSPPGETYNEHGDGLPFFQGVADFNYRHPTPRVFCTAPSRIAAPGDILLSVRAPVGRVNIADRRCAIGRGLSIIRPKKPEDGRYLEFALRMLETAWQAIEGGGSVFGNATRRDLETLCVPWPEPERDRRAIAHILGTLDDKIELNRRMSETLEAMARALFKSWFVDFLPVRAKMAAKERDPSLLLPQAEPNTWYVYAIECNDGSLYIGQTEDLRQRWLQHVGGKGASWTKQHPPVQVPYWEKQPSREAAVERENWLKTGYGRKWLKHEIAARTQTGDPVRAKCRGGVTPPLRWPQHILDLFPDSFEDSELGEIPKGWEVGTLGDVAEHPRRGVQPRIIKPDTPYIALEHMPKRCIALSDWGVADGLGSNKFEFRKGEILFGKLRPYFHKVGVAPVDGVCSTDIVVVAPRLPHWFAFLLGVVSSDEFVEYTNAGSTGTKMPRTSWAEMARYDIALPPQAVAQAFTERVRPVVDRIISAIHESRTLAALRDTLLPKLISGELRVKDAERFLERRGL